jgi:type I restriction enzyme R subunit
MAKNFAFLDSRFPVLGKLGELAENHLYADPNAALVKLGMLAEWIVNAVFQTEALQLSVDDSQAARIAALLRGGFIDGDIERRLTALRQNRNKAVHDNFSSLSRAQMLLETAYKLCVWYMQVYGDYSYEASEFVLPERRDSAAETAALKAENERLTRELETAQTTQNAARPIKGDSAQSARARSAHVSRRIGMSEAETRLLIDQQMRDAGWEADSVELRYSKGARPAKGRNRAIAEWPTDSYACKYGMVDYALFAGLKLVGVVEAKASLDDVPSAIDAQCRDYACGIRDEDAEYIISDWNGFKAPFLFAANGRAYFRQIDTKSGIWFRDARKQNNIPYALQGWPRPEGLLERLQKDIEKAKASLDADPVDALSDANGLSLRYYQIKAVQTIERAVAEGKQGMLLAMATGTGKTRTAVGIIYRFLKAKRFRRILYLVDRNVLGEQTEDDVKAYRLEQLLTLDQIFNVSYVHQQFDAALQPETSLHIATVQGMARRLLAAKDGETKPAVSDYDCIIIDEAHRGYILDREMSDGEMLYRDQREFQSLYSTLISYFDAVKIALTATPALHTTQLFGTPVYTYSYRQAVIDGYLVDHDAPHKLQTRLGRDGIHYHPGETVAVYDPATGEVVNSAELTDELDFDIEQFNKRVITEAFNRAVLGEIAGNINPEGEGKTLIFAVNDDHADLIVKILREIYEPMGVPAEAIQKITYSIGGGNPKRIKEEVRRYKNEPTPNIAVTVDLLSTGVDVPEITTLVFMRRVKSRILFEQMIGRATRLCPRIGKDHFEIYDPVGTYDSIEPLSNMKPVVQSVQTSFDDLLNGLETVVGDPSQEETDAKTQAIIDQIVAKIRRRANRITEDAAEHFAAEANGLTPVGLADHLQNIAPSEAKIYVLEHERLFQILNEGGIDAHNAVVISDKPDELLSHERGFGSGLSPEDYLAEFSAFIKGSVNEIAALNIVCTRPAELTRAALRELRQELDSRRFTETQLKTAWSLARNETIAADVISMIRQEAIGSPLVSPDARVRRAVERLKRAHSFNRIQMDWLSRIETALLDEIVADHEMFEQGAFKSKGGYARIDMVFGGQLDATIHELNGYLFDDMEATA